MKNPSKGMGLRRSRKFEYLDDLSPVTDEEFEELLNSYNYDGKKKKKKGGKYR